MLLLTRNISQNIIIGEMEAVIRILNVYPDGRVKIGIIDVYRRSVRLLEPIAPLSDDDVSSLGSPA